MASPATVSVLLIQQEGWPRASQDPVPGAGVHLPPQRRPLSVPVQQPQRRLQRGEDPLPRKQPKGPNPPRGGLQERGKGPDPQERGEHPKAKVEGDQERERRPRLNKMFT